MPRLRNATLEGLAVFGAVGVVFGLLYNTLFYPHTLVEYLEAGTIGLILGMSAGFAELTYLERRLRRRSLPQALLIRTGLYAAAVAVTLSVVLAIEPAVEGECPYFQCLAAWISGPLFLRDLVFSTGFSFLTVLSVQVVLLVGTRNFMRLMVGRFQTPREVDAVFMFVDLRGSTQIAERLGHRTFSGLLQEFFNDLADAIHAARGEVYQYVGDEVVVVWQGRRARGGSLWLACYDGMQSSIAAARASYASRYGCVPEFKAGAHCGRVMATEVGTLQRAHVYHGDVLNTAARIESTCNEAGFDLLVSEALLHTLDPALQERFEAVGDRHLKGKGERVRLFGYRPSRHGPSLEVETVHD